VSFVTGEHDRDSQEGEQVHDGSIASATDDVELSIQEEEAVELSRAVDELFGQDMAGNPVSTTPESTPESSLEDTVDPVESVETDEGVDTETVEGSTAEEVDSVSTPSELTLLTLEAVRTVNNVRRFLDVAAERTGGEFGEVTMPLRPNSATSEASGWSFEYWSNKVKDRFLRCDPTKLNKLNKDPLSYVQMFFDQNKEKPLGPEFKLIVKDIFHVERQSENHNSFGEIFGNPYRAVSSDHTRGREISNWFDALTVYEERRELLDCLASLTDSEYPTLTIDSGDILFDPEFGCSEIPTRMFFDDEKENYRMVFTKDNFKTRLDHLSVSDEHDTGLRELFWVAGVSPEDAGLRPSGFSTTDLVVVGDMSMNMKFERIVETHLWNYGRIECFFLKKKEGVLPACMLSLGGADPVMGYTGRLNSLRSFLATYHKRNAAAIMLLNERRRRKPEWHVSALVDLIVGKDNYINILRKRRLPSRVFELLRSLGLAWLQKRAKKKKRNDSNEHESFSEVRTTGRTVRFKKVVKRNLGDVRVQDDDVRIDYDALKKHQQEFAQLDAERELYSNLFEFAKCFDEPGKMHAASVAIKRKAESTDGDKMFLLPSPKITEGNVNMRFPATIEPDNRLFIQDELASVVNIMYEYDHMRGHCDGFAIRKAVGTSTLLKDWSVHRRLPSHGKDVTVKFVGETVDIRADLRNRGLVSHSCAPCCNPTDINRLARSSMKMKAMNPFEPEVQVMLQTLASTKLAQCHQPCQKCSIKADFLFFDHVPDVSPRDVCDAMEMAGAICGRIIIPWHYKVFTQMSTSGRSKRTKQYFELMYKDGREFVKCSWGDGMEHDYVHELSNIQKLVFCNLECSTNGILYSFSVVKYLKGADEQPEVLVLEVVPVKNIRSYIDPRYQTVYRTIYNQSKDALVPILKWRKESLTGGFLGKIAGFEYVNMPQQGVKSVMTALMNQQNIDWQKSLQLCATRLSTEIRGNSLALVDVQLSMPQILGVSQTLFCEAFFRRAQMGAEIKYLTDRVKEYIAAGDGGWFLEFKSFVKEIHRRMKRMFKGEGSVDNMGVPCAPSVLSEQDLGWINSMSLKKMAHVAAVNALCTNRIIYRNEPIVVLESTTTYNLVNSRLDDGDHLNFVGVIPERDVQVKPKRSSPSITMTNGLIQSTATLMAHKKALKKRVCQEVDDDSDDSDDDLEVDIEDAVEVVHENTPRPEVREESMVCDHTGLVEWDPRNKDYTCVIRCLLRHLGVRITKQTMRHYLQEILTFGRVKYAEVVRLLEAERAPTEDIYQLLAEKYCLTVETCVEGSQKRVRGDGLPIVHICQKGTGVGTLHAVLMHKPELSNLAWVDESPLDPVQREVVDALERLDLPDTITKFLSREEDDFDILQIHSANPAWIADAFFRNTNADLTVMTTANHYILDDSVRNDPRFVGLDIRLTGDDRHDLYNTQKQVMFDREHTHFIDVSTFKPKTDTELKKVISFCFTRSKFEPRFIVKVRSAGDANSIRICNMLRSLFNDSKTYQLTTSQRTLGGCLVYFKNLMYQNYSAVMDVLKDLTLHTSYPTAFTEQLKKHLTELRTTGAKTTIGGLKKSFPVAMIQMVQINQTWLRDLLNEDYQKPTLHSVKLMTSFNVKLENRVLYEKDLKARFDVLLPSYMARIKKAVLWISPELGFLANALPKNATRTDEKALADMWVCTNFTDVKFIEVPEGKSLMILRDSAAPRWTDCFQLWIHSKDFKHHLLMSKIDTIELDLSRNSVQTASDLTYERMLILAATYDFSVCQQSRSLSWSVTREGTSYIVMRDFAGSFLVHDSRYSVPQPLRDQPHEVTMIVECGVGPPKIHCYSKDSVVLTVPKNYDFANGARDVVDILRMVYKNGTSFKMVSNHGAVKEESLTKFLTKDNQLMFCYEEFKISTNGMAFDTAVPAEVKVDHFMANSNWTFGAFNFDFRSLTNPKAISVLKSLKEAPIIQRLSRHRQNKTFNLFREILESSRNTSEIETKLAQHCVKDELGLIDRNGTVIIPCLNMTGIVNAYRDENPIAISYNQTEKKFDIEDELPDDADYLMISKYAVNDCMGGFLSIYSKLADVWTEEKALQMIDNSDSIATIAGTGKSFCVAEWMAFQKDVKSAVIVASKENRNSMVSMLVKRGVTQRNAIKRVRTLASVLRLADNVAKPHVSQRDKDDWDCLLNLDRLFWDECLMQHAGVVWAIVGVLGPKKFVPLGDVGQTSYVSNLIDIGVIRHNALLSTVLECQSSLPGVLDFDLKDVVNVSYRFGATTCCICHPLYEKVYGENFVPKTIQPLSNDTLFTIIKTNLFLLDPFVVEQITKTKEHNGEVLVSGITHPCTQSASIDSRQLNGSDLTSVDPQKILTVKASQGATADLNVIIRSYDTENSMLKNDDICLVALTRAKKHTLYATKVEGDELSTIIKTGISKIEKDRRILKNYIASSSDMTTYKLFEKKFGVLPKSPPSSTTSKEPSREKTGRKKNTVGGIAKHYDWLETIDESNGVLTAMFAEHTFNARRMQFEPSKKKVKKPLSFEQVLGYSLYDSKGNKKIYTIKKEMYHGKQEERIYEGLKEKVMSTDLKQHFVFRAPDSEVAERNENFVETTDRLCDAETMAFVENRVIELKKVEEDAIDMTDKQEDQYDVDYVQEAVTIYNPNHEIKKMSRDILHNIEEFQLPALTGKMGDPNKDWIQDDSHYVAKFKTGLGVKNPGSYLSMLSPLKQRNLLAPDLLVPDVDTHTAGVELFNSWRLAYFGNKRPPPVSLDHESVIEWANRTGAQTDKTLQSYYLSILDRYLSSYEVMVKNMPKPAIESTKEMEYDNEQIITLCHKAIIHVFGPIVMQMSDWINANLPKNVKINNGITIKDLELFFEQRLPFDNFAKAFELDVKRYDKSQVGQCLVFELSEFRWFSLPEKYVDYWRVIHQFVKLYSREHGFEVFVEYQRRTGDAGTLRFNTDINMALTSRVIDVATAQVLVFAGDDVWSCGAFVKPDLHDIYAKQYNFEIKEVDFRHIYFCGRFIVDDGKKRVAMPDPLKALWKVGRNDVYTEDMLKEIALSYRVAFENYDNQAAVDVLHNHVKERYGREVPVREVVAFLRDIVSTDEKFISMFEKPTNPKKVTTHSSIKI